MSERDQPSTEGLTVHAQHHAVQSFFGSAKRYCSVKCLEASWGYFSRDRTKVHSNTGFHSAVFGQAGLLSISYNVPIYPSHMCLVMEASETWAFCRKEKSKEAFLQCNILIR